MIWQWASKCSFQFAECFGGSVLQLLFLRTYRTLTAGYCCDLLNHVKCFNRSKRFNQLRRDVIVLYGHAAPHCSSHSRKRSKKNIDWAALDRPVYIAFNHRPERLVRGDLSGALKKAMGGRQLHPDSRVEGHSSNDYVHNLPAFYNDGNSTF